MIKEKTRGIGLADLKQWPVGTKKRQKGAAAKNARSRGTFLRTKRKGNDIGETCSGGGRRGLS